MRPLSINNIRAARNIISQEFLNSPTVRVAGLPNIAFKLETLNPIKSFKGRGTDFYVASHPGDAPLVCASAGNFGQGLAYSGRARGRHVTVFAAETANPLKVQAMRDFGAEVILTGADFDAAKDAARLYCHERSIILVEDGAIPEIAEGAGTMALEMLEAAYRPIDAVFIPLGNGALASGVAASFKALSPATKVICVTADRAPAMKLSLEQKQNVSVETADTIADGIAIRAPVDYALTSLECLVDDIVSVTETEILSAMKFCLLDLGVVVEPAGAVGVAAIHKAVSDLKTAQLATILCGANISADLLENISRASYS